MPEQLWFTQFLNNLAAGPVTAFLRSLHIEPHHPQAPITNAFAMELLVFAFLILVFAILRTRLSVDSPSGLQHVFEGLQGFVEGQSHEIIGAHSEGYTPFLMALGLFILIGNLIGLIPDLSHRRLPVSCPWAARFAHFSITTGRVLNIPDWRISSTSLAPCRFWPH